ncbi:MAG: hypothetical protein HWE27_00515 [Gammaproteobacteria bacterium]|nr:hypothetical protein [Gammaproteobacteria bacterium]
MKSFLKSLLGHGVKAEMLVGVWYGKSKNSQGSITLTRSTMEKNGKAEVFFKQQHENSEPYVAIEEGDWKLERDIIIKVMKDHYDSTLEHNYKVTYVDDKTLEYKSIEQHGAEYRLYKETPERKKNFDEFLSGESVKKPSKPRSNQRPVMPMFNSAKTGMSPQEVVEHFIADYEVWNSFSCQLNDDNVVLDFVHEAYQDLLDRYCAAGLDRQGYSFRNQSHHRKAHEHIVSSKIDSDIALVVTHHTKRLGDKDYSDTYEYHLQYINDSWKISSLLAVFDSEKVECL